MIEWEKGEMDLKMLTECKNTITRNIPEVHKHQLFWCPKDMDGKPEQPGLFLYAYGGCVLKLYLIKAKKNEVWEVHFSLFDTGYEKKYFVDEHGNSTRTKEFKDRYTAVKKTDGGSKARLLRLFAMNESDWDVILNAFKTRAYAGIDGKRYLERARETVISQNNNGDLTNGIKIIEMESRIREAAERKKPDMIGVRNEGNRIILSFIEYKCTSGAMKGDCRPAKHYEDMKKYFMNRDSFDYYESYDERTDKPMLKKAADAEREILFLFSHVGTEDTKSEMSIQTAIKGIEEVNKQARKDGLADKVRVVILNDENGIIRTENIKTLDAAVRELKSRKES
ncbi:MAG: hypothetical protein K6G83_09390 [Lachnospiraceae bacterium]|nr:hypothetical protein [Lachnospiraceae bacterium]